MSEDREKTTLDDACDNIKPYHNANLVNSALALAIATYKYLKGQKGK